MLLEVVIEYVVPSLALMAAGAFLEYKFGAKVSARVTALEARLATLEGKASAAVDAAKKAA